MNARYLLILVAVSFFPKAGATPFDCTQESPFRKCFSQSVVFENICHQAQKGFSGAQEKMAQIKADFDVGGCARIGDCRYVKAVDNYRKSSGAKKDVWNCAQCDDPSINLCKNDLNKDCLFGKCATKCGYSTGSPFYRCISYSVVFSKICEMVDEQRPGAKEKLTQIRNDWDVGGCSRIGNCRYINTVNKSLSDEGWTCPQCESPEFNLCKTEANVNCLFGQCSSSSAKHEHLQRITVPNQPATPAAPKSQASPGEVNR